jgi:hypothetical protein
MYAVWTDLSTNFQNRQLANEFMYASLWEAWYLLQNITIKRKDYYFFQVVNHKFQIMMKVNAAPGVGFLHYNDKAQPYSLSSFISQMLKDFISSRVCIQCV